MIITNIADGQVTKDDLVEFNFRDIAYEISAGAQKVTGQVPAQSYRNLDVQSALGPGPYQVGLGYVNHSYFAKPVTVNSADALVMFWMAFPAGPNGPKTFVFEKK
jgi:hypothetical protein